MLSKSQQRRRYLRSMKLCADCGVESMDHHCPTCKEKQNIRLRKLRRYRKENGLCYQCGEKLDRKGGYCTKCNKHRQELKNNPK